MGGPLFPLSSVETQSCGCILSSVPSRMFLLLALILQVVQIHGQRGCYLAERDADFGQDYYSWTSVGSLRECQNKCLDRKDWDQFCIGFTYVHNNRRNCALYDHAGIEEGVKRRGQDSYKCTCGSCAPTAGGWKPNFLSAGSG